ncbi:mandelate racemase/muconate lactonizing enzyme family protein [Candidatus Rhodobacter oscarellae]|uniref:Mandelate racemase/muconate lactonizing enzyme family protein n=1 Tax=Candidatus Rhodobacter oscarellae TaxID=1675527 RepID=A0A0J9ECE4_9RHOB|nr:mandelate racemase/muconate lactonizing enzyme family protein [Candidatus Rhodobacter lobularis]KMW59379.1 mandelate racemase/muconate lactonizing enzyme family protein [Candidatus Rhodobacter lobularis]
MDKIAKLETFSTADVGFVRVTMEDGSQGWGQVSTYHSDITCLVLHRQVAPWVLGQDCTDLDDLLDLVTEREHKFPGSYLRRAMGGVDTAIWDMRGKRAGKPVAELLGGSAGPLRAYGSSMKRDITPAAEADRLKRLADAQGFDAFKIRVGAEVGRNQDEWPGRTEEIIPTMRAALPDAALLADANSCFTPTRAIEVGKMLEANGFCHYEEPCPYWELEQTKEVTEALEIDVTGGEQDCDLPTWRRMIDMRAVDIVQPDVMYLGGIARTLRVCRMAEAAGLPVTPHCANLSMVTLFTMHLLRAIPNAGKYLEFSIEGADYYPWQYDLFTEDPFTITDGQALVTEAPGWGVEISPEWLARASYQVSELA